MKRNHKNHLDLPAGFSLESLRDQNPFRVPDGYFDELAQRVQARIETHPVQRKSRHLHPGVFAAAASVVILLGLTLVMRTSVMIDSSDVQLAAIPDTHIVKHFERVISNGEIDEPMLVDAVVNASAKETSSAVSTTAANSASAVATDILPTVSDEEIIDYLVQNTSPANLTTEINQ